jgi:hypothetical protein
VTDRAAIKMPVHPAVRIQSRLLLIVLSFCVLAGALTALGGATWSVGSFLAIAGLCVWALLSLGRRGRAVQLHNAALERLLRGRDQEAEELLDQIPARDLRRGAVARAAGTQRALIALHRGDSARAVELTSGALAQRFSHVPGLRPNEEMHRAKALALRALAHASLGHEAEAASDAAAAEIAPNATPDVLARASLSRSVVLARKNERAMLAAHLAHNAGLMLQWLTPRERALVRALRRMARAPAKSVYRESARPDEASDEAKLASWIGKLAPGAEAFARETGGYVPALESLGPTVAATPTARQSVERSREDAARGVKRSLRNRVLVLWLALVAAFFGIFLAMGSGDTHTSAGGVHFAPGSGLPILAGVAVFAALVLQARRLRGWARALSEAQLDVARGELSKAESALAALTRKRADSIAAGAHLCLAQLAERRVAWSQVVVHCDSGIGRLSRTPALKAANSDVLFPELVATRAYALAASDRQDEANAELAVLAKEFPAYVVMARAHFRVGLMSAVRRGDLEAASRVATSRTPDLPLSIRDDMLADVVLAATTAVPQHERERIDAELQDDAELRAWVDAVAPGIRERRPTRIGDEAGAGAAAEAIALAESEAEADAHIPAGAKAR